MECPVRETCSDEILETSVSCKVIECIFTTHIHG